MRCLACDKVLNEREAVAKRKECGGEPWDICFKCRRVVLVMLGRKLPVTQQERDEQTERRRRIADDPATVWLSERGFDGNGNALARKRPLSDGSDRHG